MPLLFAFISTHSLMRAPTHPPPTSTTTLAAPLSLPPPADIFDFTLRFDALRMERPFLPNDFSYYRRLLPKFNKHPAVKIKDDEASGMALFTAEHIPMMTTLARACPSDAQEPRNQHIMEALALMANSCMKMIKNKKSHEQRSQRRRVGVARAGGRRWTSPVQLRRTDSARSLARTCSASPSSGVHLNPIASAMTLVAAEEQRRSQ